MYRSVRVPLDICVKQRETALRTTEMTGLSFSIMTAKLLDLKFSLYSAKIKAVFGLGTKMSCHNNLLDLSGVLLTVVRSIFVHNVNLDNIAVFLTQLIRSTINSKRRS